VTLRRVIEAVEGPIQINDRRCPVHPVWGRLQALVSRELDRVTIGALARAARERPPLPEAPRC
jgi:DNA-binding IscR family transcriptional regulator